MDFSFVTDDVPQPSNRTTNSTPSTSAQTNRITVPSYHEVQQWSTPAPQPILFRPSGLTNNQPSFEARTQAPAPQSDKRPRLASQAPFTPSQHPPQSGSFTPRPTLSYGTQYGPPGAAGPRPRPTRPTPAFSAQASTSHPSLRPSPAASSAQHPAQSTPGLAPFSMPTPPASYQPQPRHPTPPPASQVQPSQPVSASAAAAAAANAIIVNRKQQGNPVLRHIRNVRWQFGDIAPDYQLGQYTCALFLSLRYHLLHPDYIMYRIKELQRAYRLMVVLCQVDVEDVVKPLGAIIKTAAINDCTLICAWSPEECARYLETLKSYETKPAAGIQERVEADYLSRLTSTLTSVRSINKTDAYTLGTNFGSLADIMAGSKEQFAACPGIGPTKVQRLWEAFNEPFRRSLRPTGGAGPAAASSTPGASTSAAAAAAAAAGGGGQGSRAGLAATSSTVAGVSGAGDEQTGPVSISGAAADVAAGAGQLPQSRTAQGTSAAGACGGLPGVQAGQTPECVANAGPGDGGSHKGGGVAHSPGMVDVLSQLQALDAADEDIDDSEVEED